MIKQLKPLHIIALVFLLSLPTISKAVVVLQYHHIETTTPSSTSTSISLFKEQIEYLIKNDFIIVSLPSVVEDLKNQKQSKDKTVAITFDDGYISVYEHAFPILKQHNIPFTVFVNTSPLEENQPSHVSWEQLEEMKAHGATIANHTHKHSHLMKEGYKGDTWKEAFIDEIKTAQRILKKRLNQDVRLFAYPYGEFDEASNNLLAELGYIGFGQHSGAVGPNMNLQSLPRFPASNQYGRFPSLATKLNSTAFEGVEFKPSYGVISQGSENPPRLFIHGAKALINNINCFGSSVGALPRLKSDDQSIVVSSTKPFNARRFRYNCTARSPSTGNFSWVSIPWVDITKRED